MARFVITPVIIQERIFCVLPFIWFSGKKAGIFKVLGYSNIKWDISVFLIYLLPA